MKKKKVNLRDLKPDSEEQHSHDDGHDNSGNSSDIKAYISAIIKFYNANYWHCFRLF